GGAPGSPTPAGAPDGGPGNQTAGPGPARRRLLGHLEADPPRPTPARWLQGPGAGPADYRAVGASRLSAAMALPVHHLSRSTAISVARIGQALWPAFAYRTGPALPQSPNGGRTT